MREVMDKVWATARTYFIPLLVLSIAVLTLAGDPNKPILKGVPIVPGDHRYEIAAGFAAIAAVLAFMVYRHEKRKPPAS
jgi:hypothetical protein